MRYNFDGLPESTNITKFIFVHNILVLYARFFSLIKYLCIYIINLPLAVLSVPLYSDIVLSGFLDLCIVSIFPSQGNLV